MNRLQDQGRALHKGGEYRQAIDFFDRAIGRATSVQLLDNRAACYEKLSELPSALKDAKAAISLHREDATGYLRAGRILVKMEKPAVALDIYTHGLKCIKHVGQGYELLKQAHKKVLDVVSPQNSVDPLTMLPRELAEIILEHLSFRERTNLSLVSKGWLQFIRSSPNLWSHLDLSEAQSRKKVRPEFISRAINTGRSKLRRASLSMLWDFDKTLKALVKQCPLEELVLLDCGLQGSNLVNTLKAAKHLKSFEFRQGTKIPDPDLTKIFDAISDRIETISVHVDEQKDGGKPGGVIKFDCICPNLTTLQARWVSTLRSGDLVAEAPERFPKIKSLAVLQRHSQTFARPGMRIDLAKCKDLTYLDLGTTVWSADTLTLPQSLTSLHLSIIGMPGPARYECFQALVDGAGVVDLPNLDEFSVVASGRQWFQVCLMLLWGSDHGQRIDPSTRPVSKLRTLSITNGGHEFNIVHITELTENPRLKSLEHLALRKAPGCDDDSIKWIIECWPMIRTLDLAGSGITGVGVREVAKLKNLEELVLDDCRSLGADAVAWAREQGLKVRYKMKSESGRGRRVRY